MENHYEPFLSPRQIAAEFNLRAPHVRKLVTQGKLRGYKIGGLVRVRRGDWLAFCEANLNVNSAPLAQAA